MAWCYGIMFFASQFCDDIMISDETTNNYQSNCILDVPIAYDLCTSNYFLLAST